MSLICEPTFKRAAPRSDPLTMQTRTGLRAKKEFNQRQTRLAFKRKNGQDQDLSEGVVPTKRPAKEKMFLNAVHFPAGWDANLTLSEKDEWKRSWGLESSPKRRTIEVDTAAGEYKFLSSRDEMDLKSYRKTHLVSLPTEFDWNNFYSEPTGTIRKFYGDRIVDMVNKYDFISLDVYLKRLQMLMAIADSNLVVLQKGTTLTIVSYHSYNEESNCLGRPGYILVKHEHLFVNGEKFLMEVDIPSYDRIWFWNGPHKSPYYKKYPDMCQFIIPGHITPVPTAGPLEAELKLEFQEGLSNNNRLYNMLIVCQWHFKNNEFVPEITKQEIPSDEPNRVWFTSYANKQCMFQYAEDSD